MRHRSAEPAIAPRDRQAATRAIAYFMMVGGAVLGLCALFIPGFAGYSTAGIVATAATTVTMVLLGAACRRFPDRVPEVFWVGIPMLAVVLIGGLDLLTADSSVGAQLYFLWPVLYAATFLRRSIVYTVLGMVYVADFLVVFTLEPPGQAFSDSAGMVTALTMATVIIIKLRKRADDLVAVLEAQALSDPLTGLANRRAFARDIEQAVDRAGRTGEPLSMLTFDVDHFKRINDTWGHAAGDVALQAVADALRAVARRSDIVARLGGDEFVMLITGDRVGGLRVAAALRAAVARATHIPGGPPTLSIGLATMPDDAESADKLSAASDAALYNAKAGGRDRVATVPDRGGVQGRPASAVPVLDDARVELPPGGRGILVDGTGLGADPRRRQVDKRDVHPGVDGLGEDEGGDHACRPPLRDLAQTAVAEVGDLRREAGDRR